MLFFDAKLCACGLAFSRRQGERSASFSARKTCDACTETHWRELPGHDRRGARQQSIAAKRSAASNKLRERGHV